jgi:hypothetical protein
MGYRHLSTEVQKRVPNYSTKFNYCIINYYTVWFFFFFFFSILCSRKFGNCFLKEILKNSQIYTRKTKFLSPLPLKKSTNTNLNTKTLYGNNTLAACTLINYLIFKNVENFPKNLFIYLFIYFKDFNRKKNFESSEIIFLFLKKKKDSKLINYSTKTKLCQSCQGAINSNNNGILVP